MAGLRSTAKTIGAMCGNDMLDRAAALVRELKIPARLRDDAAHEAVLAELEGRDPAQAVTKFVDDERCTGLTGGGTRPTVFHLTQEQWNRVPGEEPFDVAERVDAAAERLQVAGAVLVKATKRQRQMLTLVALGWTHDEIAEHLGLSREHVGKELSRIAKRSRELLARNHS